MAYNPFEDEEDELGQAGPAGTGTANYGTTQAANPSSSSRFINFGDYFKANGGQQAGDKLVSGLEGAAGAAQTASTGARTNLTNQAATGTVQAPVMPAAVTQPIARSPDRIYEAPKLPGYSGPSQETATAAFAPIGTAATTAVQRINQSKDAAGVKAVQGGTGFDATLAYAGAGGRLGQLRNKYGGLVSSVNADQAATNAAIGTAEATSKASGETYETQKKEEQLDRAAPQARPPTDEPGRWMKIASGHWVENPGYTNPMRKPIPTGYRKRQTSTGVTTYG